MQSDGTASVAAGHPTAYKHDLAGYTKVLNFFMAYDQSHLLPPAPSVPTSSAQATGSRLPLPSPSLTPPPINPLPLPLLPPTTIVPSAPPSSPPMSNNTDLFGDYNDLDFSMTDVAMADDMADFLNTLKPPPTAPVNPPPVDTATPGPPTTTTVQARPKPCPVCKPSPLLPPSTSSDTITNDLLLYPCLSMMLTLLNSTPRKAQHARIMALSDSEREKEEEAAAFPSFNLDGHRNKEVLSSLPLPPAPDPVISPSKMTPTRAAMIALKHINATMDPPASPSPTSSTLPSAFPAFLAPSPHLLFTLPSAASSSHAKSPFKPLTTSSTTPKLLEAADLKKAPAWLKNAYGSFSKLPYGNTWLSFLNQLIELERGYGFVSPVSPRFCFFVPCY